MLCILEHWQTGYRGAVIYHDGHMVTNRKLNTWCNPAHSMAKEPGKLECYGLDLTLDAGLALLWQDSAQFWTSGS